MAYRRPYRRYRAGLMRSPNALPQRHVATGCCFSQLTVVAKRTGGHVLGLELSYPTSNPPTIYQATSQLPTNCYPVVVVAGNKLLKLP